MGKRIIIITLSPSLHFPAIEVPDDLVEEVRAFFRPLRGSGG